MRGSADARRRQDARAGSASCNALSHFSGADEAESVGIGGDRKYFHFRLCDREINVDSIRLKWCTVASVGYGSSEDNVNYSS